MLFPLISLSFEAMFHPPASLNDNVQHFLTLSEAQKILADLNQILHKTAFNPKPSNPCFLLAVLFTFVCSGFFPFVITTGLENSTDQNRGFYIGGTIGALIFAIVLAYTCFFCLTCHFRTSRKRQLTNYVAQVNRWFKLNLIIFETQTSLQSWEWCQVFFWGRGHHAKGKMTLYQNLTFVLL